jgi:pimeloyl-ACP methyl ester carboxylesterase
MPIDLSHAAVTGAPVDMVEVRHAGGGAMREPFSALSGEPRTPGIYTVSFRIEAGPAALEIPPCAGRGAVRVDGERVQNAGSGTGTSAAIVADISAKSAHDVSFDVKVSSYEKALRCAYPPRAGTRTQTDRGLSWVSFPSPSARLGGGHAVVFVPRGYQKDKPAPLLVGVHPWNGDEWTYANYTELLDEADARGVILLMPNGLGNTLYQAPSEAEVLRAMSELSAVVSVDAARTSIWGASMGGQGATTIGFHAPDRFATVTSFFGDARFDLSTYVKNLLPTEEAAHAVNPLDVAVNARHQKVLLIHGEDDHTSPIKESIDLDAGLRAFHYDVTFVRHPRMGHEAPMIMLHIRDIVRTAATSSIPESPRRVTFRGVRPGDLSAYGVSVTRTQPGVDVFVDIERVNDEQLRVNQLSNVAKITLRRVALGGTAGELLPVSFAKGVRSVPVERVP